MMTNGKKKTDNLSKNDALITSLIFLFQKVKLKICLLIKNQ